MTSIILRSKRPQVRILPGVLTQNDTRSKFVLLFNVRLSISSVLEYFSSHERNDSP